MLLTGGAAGHTEESDLVISDTFERANYPTSSVILKKSTLPDGSCFLPRRVSRNSLIMETGPDARRSSARASMGTEQRGQGRKKRIHAFISDILARFRVPRPRGGNSFELAHCGHYHDA